MKYVVFFLGFLSTLAFSVFALVYFPKIASRLNETLPDRPSRMAKLWLPPGGRYDSPKILDNAFMSGVGGMLMAAFLAVVLVMWAVQDISAVIRAHR